MPEASTQDAEHSHGSHPGPGSASPPGPTVRLATAAFGLGGLLLVD